MFSSLIPSASADKATVEAALLGLLGIIFGSVFGYFAKYYLDRKQTFSSANGSIKREMYIGYIEKLLDISSRNMQTLTSDEVAKIQKEFGEQAKAFYKSSLLFASPEVVKAYAEFVRHASSNNDSDLYKYELMLKSSRLYKAMRKDIGLSNRHLGIDGELLLRANINDYDTTIGKYVTIRKRLFRWLKEVW